MAEPSGPPRRQCGRCRLLFDGDPTLEPQARPQWWLCPPCRAFLLPNRPAEADTDPDLALLGADNQH
jgi:hypothetical protein